jgi:aminoglycoside phosphotransferase (APT) family kinase protein
MALARAREVAGVRAGIEAWSGSRVDDLTQPTSGGLSSETYLFRIGDERLVLRLPPAGDALFPDYDLAQQARLMRDLDGVVPVPRVRELVDDTTYFGASFIVMEQVSGRIPTDNPSYLREGWVKDAPADEQRLIHDHFADCIARLHRSDVGRYDDARMRIGLAAEVTWWTEYLDWAAEGSPPEQLLETLQWCDEHLPAESATPSLCWGDVRLPNVVFDDAARVVALLDWEMASIAPAELDLGWFLVVHRMSVDVVGHDLPGFRARDDFLRRYEEQLGRRLADLAWYEAWAAFRSAAIMVRLASLLHGLGLVDDLRMRERNPSTKLLRTLLF